MVAEAVIEQQRREFGSAPASSASKALGQFQPNIATGFIVNLLLTGNVTLAQPVGLTPPVGTVMYLVLTQDSTGSRTVGFASCYRDPPNWAAGGAAGTVASGEFRWDGNSWQFVGGSSVFAAPGISLFTGAGQIQVAAGGPPTLLSNPAPSVGAVAASGVAPSITRGTSTVIAPTVGSAATGSTAVVQSQGITPSVTPGFSLAIAGNAPVRTP